MPTWDIQANQVFLSAIELPTHDRDAYVDHVCQADASLRGRVERLLQAASKAGSFFDVPAVALRTPFASAALEPVGSLIGPYRLLEKVGEGGMGVVYVAEQVSPVRRKVALKIIKPGMDSRQVIARFEAERQALALMDHPHIARILDAGMTDGRGDGAGLPYFVMELVPGLPITEYCDQARLHPRQRLALFIDVCWAVQHAHQKGIIHRDLKPSNVLVTLHDGKPVAKVIDFGVAKAMGRELTEHTIYTAFSQLIGTPLYMSPEQAELSGLDIDTRSDVYSLGVLLYELLTGQTPFDRATFLKAGHDEMRRMIREDEPPRPSQRISTLNAAARSTLADQRGLDPKRLGQLLRGELDWIVMKCLEKDRARRYESATSLARDVSRYLADEAVEACPPSRVYRLCKTVRRHRRLVVVATTIGTLVIVGAMFSTRQAIQTSAALTKAKESQAAAELSSRRATDNFRRALAAIDEMVLTVNDENVRNIPQTKVFKDALLAKAEVLYDSYIQQEDYGEAVRYEIALAHLGMSKVYASRHKKAEMVASAQRSVELIEQLLRESPDSIEYSETLGHALFNRGRCEVSSGDRRQASETLLRALAHWENLAAAFPSHIEYRRELGNTLERIGYDLRNAIDPIAYQSYLRRTVDVRQQLVAENPDVAEYRTDLGRAYESLGSYSPKDREKALLSAIKYHSNPAPIALKLASVYIDSKRFSDAEGVLRESLDDPHRWLTSRESTYFIYHQTVQMLAGALQTMGSRVDAESVYLSEIAVLSERFRQSDNSGKVSQLRSQCLADLKFRLGRLYETLHRSEEAVQQFREARALFKQAERSADEVLTSLELARCFAHAGQIGASELEIAEVSKDVKAKSKRPLIAKGWVELAGHALRMSDVEAANRACDQAKAIIANWPVDYSSPYPAPYGDGYGASGTLARYSYTRDRFDLGALLATLRRMDEAKEQWHNVFQVSPSAELGDWHLHIIGNELAWRCATSQWEEARNPALAVALATQAVEYSQPFVETATSDVRRVIAGFWNTLGVSHYRAANWEECMKSLTRSMELNNGGVPHDWLFLAMAKCEVGEREEAVEWYQKSVDWIESNNRSEDEELSRFCAEAAERLDIEVE